MTWGSQNTEAEAHEQLNYAFDEAGLNFLDTAEMCASHAFLLPLPGALCGTLQTCALSVQHVNKLCLAHIRCMCISWFNSFAVPAPNVVLLGAPTWPGLAGRRGRQCCPHRTASRQQVLDQPTLARLQVPSADKKRLPGRHRQVHRQLAERAQPPGCRHRIQGRPRCCPCHIWLLLLLASPSLPQLHPSAQNLMASQGCCRLRLAVTPRSGHSWQSQRSGHEPPGVHLDTAPHLRLPRGISVLMLGKPRAHQGFQQI